MKNKFLISAALLFLLIPCCSGIQINENNVKTKLISEADALRKDKAGIYKLDKKIIGNTGYFYIIRNNGTLSYHPKKALINFDFSRYPFVGKVLKDRNGCLSYNADGFRRYIFFTEIDSSEILCLTIESGEFNDPVTGCDSDSKDFNGIR